jgi:hypothetical protein
MPLPDYEIAPDQPYGLIPCPFAIVFVPLGSSFPPVSSNESSFQHATPSFSFKYHLSSLHAKTMHQI